MADRARPPKTETDPEHSSPAAKKSKLSEETVTAGTSSEVSKSELTPCLESSEVLAASSDESFGEADEDKGKISIGKVRTTLATARLPTAGPSRLQQQQATTSQVLLRRCDVSLFQQGRVRNSLMGERSLYREISCIGDGAYGTVYKARDVTNGQVVALKKIRVPITEDGLPTSTLREIAALRHLERFEHPQIVKLLDVCQGNFLDLASTEDLSERLDRNLTLWLVFEHVERDLARFISACSSQTCKIAPRLIRQMSREILAGVDFLHSHRIVHRDLKPQNLLVTRDGHIKIADFGLAKTYDFMMRLTSVVVTLWYRAPEVLLGCSYATPIDIWSVGCILAELNELKPLFPGSSEGDQLDKIFRIIGTPPKEEWPERTSLGFAAFPVRPSAPLKMVIPYLNDSGRDLIQNMLIFNPRRRLTAAQALKHPYFTDSEF